MRTSGLSGRRCASCHVEHGGTEALRASDSAICADCHSAPDRNMPGSELQAVSGFGDADHPPFRVRLVSLSPGGEPEWQRMVMDGPVSEDSGLFFPHDAHLVEEGVQGPEGKETLACADCHRPGAAGMTMQPVRFEQDCQRCHQLDFEPEAPDRQLPHGKPEVVLDMLEEFYSRVALRGGFDRPDAEVDPPAVVKRERTAQDTLDEEGRRAALAWAQQQAGMVAREMFEYRACRTCHQVARTPDEPAGWQVQRVHLTQNWFPHAEFTHARHEQMACNDCHEADTSDASTDVLMPGIDNCVECHGGQDATGRVASGCVDCHGFHTADQLHMGSQDDEMARSQ
ncbi:MAG: cytochrome c3 family protein [Rhodovibrio sp.]|nr:cytochrome c3 family protein [Rhodovibrio sp.]